jgi:DNA ligase D-like protein (predicted ligase)
MNPMLAKLSHETFSDADWIFERKLDGERCLTFRQGDEIRLLSRNQKQLNVTYPEIVEAIGQLESDRFIIDGEIVTFEDSLTSFEKLQDRLQIRDPQEVQESGVEVFYYVFDLLYLDCWDTTQIDLRHRKSLLKQAFSFQDPLRFTTHRNEVGEEYFKEACQKGWEGLIAKRASSSYVQKRSSHWRKFRCSNQQEFIIGGYTDPEGERIGFGALLIGYYENDKLRYAGKVGTGFDDETLRRLHERLSAIERETSPFDDKDLPHKDVHWVSPELVGQIAFTEWTQENKLRHPRYLGLRRDKEPQEVVKEQAGS